MKNKAFGLLDSTREKTDEDDGMLSDIRQYRKGIENIVNICVEKDEKILVLHDKACKNIADSIANSGSDISEHITATDGTNMMGFTPKRLFNFKKALNSSDGGIVMGNPYDLINPMSMMEKQIINNKDWKYIFMPYLTEQIVKDGCAADYSEVKNMTDKVSDICKHANKAEVTSETGTDFIVKFNQDYTWGLCDGVIRKGVYNNLPGGEVFATPDDFEGIVVVDGVMGLGYDKFGTLEQNPLSYEVSKGRIIEDTIKCDRQALYDKVKHEIFHMGYENADRMGEFALGTNIFLDSLISNILQDEKFPGVHVAWGHSITEVTGADWKSDVHVDCILQKTTVKIDGQKIMDKGVYLI